MTGWKKIALRLVFAGVCIALWLGLNLLTAPERAEGPGGQPTRNYGEARLDREDGVVTDRRTGLQWTAACSDDPLVWKDAKQWCESRRDGGKSDWRLPTAGELLALYDHLGAIEPRIDRRVDPFDWGDAAGFWTSDRYLSYTSSMLTVYFHTGVLFNAYKNYLPPLHYARAVRENADTEKGDK